MSSVNPTGGADEIVDRLAAEILFQLGRPGIDWTGMQEDQLRTVRSWSSHSISIWFLTNIFLRRLVAKEVDEIPPFVASLVYQLLTKEITAKSKDCE